MRITRFYAVAVATVVASGVVLAQGRGSAVEWPVTYGDAQQTSWIRTDAAISPDSLSKPGFELQWKTKLDNQPRQLSSLATGVTVYGVTLFVPMSTVTGSSNNVYAIDNDTGFTVWQRHFDAPLGAAASVACPGGITAAATRVATLAPAPLAAARAGGAGGGGGRGGYSSNVFGPGEGVPQPAGRGGGRGAPPAGVPAAPGAPAGAPAAPGAAGGPGNAPPGAAPGAAPAPGGGGAAAGRGAPGAAAGGAQGGGGRGGAAAAPGIPGAGPGVGGGGGFGRASGVVYVVSGDGLLHVLGLPSGKDMQKPAPFLPAGARSSDPIAVGEILYAATSAGCGSAPNGVWAINLEDQAKPVTSWKTNGGSVVGSLSFTTDGTVLASIGAGQAAAGGYANAIVALDPKTLQLKDWFTQPSTEFVSSPLVFRQNNKDIVAAATKDGRVLLLDANSLGGTNHSTPMYASRSFVATGGTVTPGALAMWQEAITLPGAPAAVPAPPAPAGGPGGGAPGGAPAPIVQPSTRWLLVPVAGRLAADAQLPNVNGAVTNGAILALKVNDDAGTLSLVPGWVSRDLTSPVTPLIVNGVVFAASSGKPQTGTTAADITRRATPAVLYALNGTTGKELWNSAKTITSFMPGRNMWAGNSQVYVSAFDGTVYAFGFAQERR